MYPRTLAAFLLSPVLAASLLVGPRVAAQTQKPSAPKVQLEFPLKCSLGQTCWIARYNDRKKGKGKADYMCGRRTQNAHKGTDFVITDYGQMERGVPVLAAFEGTVLRLREGVEDTPVTKENSAEKKKIGCGNAVILSHKGGYQTSYCHMKKGSLTVKVGDTVKAGEQIGSVGLSGLTEYPHLHFGLRKEGGRIDPFDGKRTNARCGAGTAGSLWKDTPPYTDMDLMPLVFSTKPLTRQTRWAKPVVTIPKNAPALVITGRAWNVLAGDRWLFHIIRPDGVEATERSFTVKENRQSQWYANRLFRPKGGFMTGTWRGHLMVIRQHQDGTVTRFEEETEIRVTQ